MVERPTKADQLRAFREARALSVERAAAKSKSEKEADAQVTEVKHPKTFP
jgi:hypothetical protein